MICLIGLFVCRSEPSNLLTEKNILGGISLLTEHVTKPCHPACILVHSITRSQSAQIQNARSRLTEPSRTHRVRPRKTGAVSERFTSLVRKTDWRLAFFQRWCLVRSLRIHVRLPMDVYGCVCII